MKIDANKIKMNQSSYLIFFLFLLLQAHMSAKTNEFHFNYLTSDQGLSSNAVTCILQDSRGFMWFGTNRGLNCYNGYDFELFSRNVNDSNSISSNYITCIAEDNSGNLWVGTNDGLNIFNRKNHRFGRIINNTNNGGKNGEEYIHALAIDGDSIWVATKNVLKLYSTKTIEYKVFNIDSTFSGKTVLSGISSVFPDGDNVWVGTTYYIYIYNKKTGLFKPCPLMPKFQRTEHISKDCYGNVWIATKRSGVVKLLNADWSRAIYYGKKEGLTSNNVLAIVHAPDSNSYLITMDDAMVKYSGPEDEFIKISPDKFKESSLSSKALRCIYQSPDGIIWIGTFDDGLNLIDENKKEFLNYRADYRPNALLNNKVRAVYEDCEQNIWIGTKEIGGGLSLFNKEDGDFVNYPASPSVKGKLHHNYVFSICDLDKNKLLIGTLRGLSVFDKKKKSFSKLNLHANELIRTGVRSIYVLHKDIQGNIWVAGRLLFKYKQSNSQVEYLPEILDVRSICDHDAKHIWVAEISGALYLLNTETNAYKVYNANKTKTEMPLGKRIISIYKSKAGVLYIGTDEGLCIFDIPTEKFEALDVKPSPPSCFVCKILEDEETGNIWISTKKGLNCYNPTDRTYHNFNKKDGLLTDEFANWVGCSTRKKEMIFGSAKGFCVFKPSQIKENKTAPRLVFNSLKIFDEQVNAGDETGVLSKDISETTAISLNHKQSVFSVEFVALNYTTPGQNFYRYRLDGLEKKWNYTEKNRIASYSNLDAGEYTLLVYAANNDGVWNEQGIRLNITILPPFWKRWWFRFCVIVFVLGSIVFYFLWREKELQQQNILLENKVIERTKKLKEANVELEKQKKEISKHLDLLEQKNTEIQELNKSKLQFFTNISHEFRTPLTLILGPLEKLLKQKSTNHQANELHQMMHRNGMRLQHLINRLMDFRRLEQGKMQLSASTNNLVFFVSVIKKAFDKLAEQQEIDFRFETEKKEILCSFDTEKIEAILYNLLSNAFKFTPKKGAINIRVKQDVSSVSVSVSDTGIGIPREQQEAIFERFKQLPSEKNKYCSSGVGLAFAKELIELHKGSICVKSKLNKGSCFTFSLPLQDGIEKGVINENVKYRLSETNMHRLQKLSNNFGRSKIGEKIIEKSKAKANAPLLLLAEDNADLRQYIKTELSEEYHIIIAENGKEGLDNAVKYSPDIVISDVIMPEMDGFELCKKLKTDLVTSHIPIVLLTAYASETGHIEGLKEGADDYIPKPFSTEVLKARVHNLLESRRNLRQLFTQQLNVEPSEIAVSRTDEQFLRKLIKIVEENMENVEFSVEMLCELVGASRSSLYRKLESIVNLNATDFIRELRLKRAAQLLTKSDYRIVEIQHMVGFINKSTFNRAFKKKFGVSPSEFIGQHRR